MQAILIQAHKDIVQLRKLIAYFCGRCDVFIHIDKKAPFSDEEIGQLAKQNGVKGVYRQYSVHWGGFSILRCEIFLLRKALKNSDATYFHLVSGQDYPLRPLDDFLDYFESTALDGFLSCRQLPFSTFDHGTFYRMQHYVLTDYIEAKAARGKAKVQKIIDWQAKWGLRRRIPDQFERLYGGSAWFSISRKSALYLSDYTKDNPAFYQRLRFTYCPEEVYVPTVLMNSPLSDTINAANNFRCMLWDNPGSAYSPLELTDDHLERILKKGRKFFARKFNYPSCKLLVEKIDKYMLSYRETNSSGTGCWQCRSLAPFDYDRGLALGLIYLCEAIEAKTVCDFGCGAGYYVSDLQEAGIIGIGYDGNPHTRELTSMLMPAKTKVPCECLDLTENFNVNTPYTVSLLLNVGEYVPPQYISVMLDRIADCTDSLMVVSWRSSDGGDKNIVSPMNRERLAKEMHQRGFIEDGLATNVVRSHCYQRKNKENIVVFRISLARAVETAKALSGIGHAESAKH